MVPGPQRCLSPVSIPCPLYVYQDLGAGRELHIYGHLTPHPCPLHVSQNLEGACLSGVLRAPLYPLCKSGSGADLAFCTMNLQRACSATHVLTGHSGAALKAALVKVTWAALPVRFPLSRPLSFAQLRVLSGDDPPPSTLHSALCRLSE